MIISFQKFSAFKQNFFRGVIKRGNVWHYTRRKFFTPDDAELYAIKLAMRYRSIFEAAQV